MGGNTGKLCSSAATAAEMPAQLISPLIGSRPDKQKKRRICMTVNHQPLIWKKAYYMEYMYYQKKNRN